MSDFKTKTEEIRKLMATLHNKFKSENETPSDKDIAIISQAFYKRDKNPNDVDVELLHVMRGFDWGMRAMRQIIEGNDLPIDNG